MEDLLDCRTCGELKPPEAFSPRKKYTNRKRELYCRDCMRKKTRQWREENKDRYEENKKVLRDSVRFSKYGITRWEYEDLLEIQGYRCPICNSHLDDDKPIPYKPHIDHDHKTGTVRGILCGNCNTGIGQLKDSIEVLQNAIKYLQSNTPKE